MTLATTPTSHLTVPERTARAITSRWHEWDGRVLVKWGANPPSGLERAHFEWMLDLLNQGIPIRAIRRLNLDDPRVPRLELKARAELYTDRSRRKRSVTNANHA